MIQPAGGGLVNRGDGLITRVKLSRRRGARRRRAAYSMPSAGPLNADVGAKIWQVKNRLAAHTANALVAS